MAENKKVLILGGGGFVGGRTAQEAVKQGWEVFVTYRNNAPDLEGCQTIQFDWMGNISILDILAELNPAVIINSSVPAIGVSAPADEHFAVSLGGVQKLVTALEKLGQMPKLIQVSTNAVFDGTKGDYAENDLPVIEARQDSFSAYGVSKAQAEKYVLENYPDSVVARTSLVWGRDYKGDLNRRTQLEIVTPLQEGRKFRRFADRYVSPTAVDSLASALIELVILPFRGIVNVAGREQLTDVQFAAKIARYLRLDKSLIEPENRPPTMPAKLTLNVSLAKQIFKTPMLDIAEQLKIIFPQKVGG
jgi:dTDP-4-dehydrorhamnose reductase